MRKNKLMHSKKIFLFYALFILVIIALVYFLITLTAKLNVPKTNSDQSIDYQSVVYNNEALHRLTITDEEDARAALDSIYKDFDIGDSSTSSMLGNCTVSTITGNTYYRFQQIFKGIPVYGHSMILVTDDENKGAFVVSNYFLLDMDVVSPSISKEEAFEKICAVTDEPITGGTPSSELVIYVGDNNVGELTWKLSIASLDVIYFVSAEDGKVLDCVSMQSFAISNDESCSTAVITQVSNEIGADLAVQMQLDAGENIIIFNAGGQQFSWFDYEHGRIDLVDSSGNVYVMTGSQTADGSYGLKDLQGNELWMKYTNLEKVQKKITIVDNNQNIITTDAWWRPRPHVNDQFIAPISSAEENETTRTIRNAWQQAEQFYENVLNCKWLANENGIWYVAYNADVPRLQTGSYPQLGFAVTELKQGDKNGASEAALMHELAHPFQREVIPDYYGKWETGAIEEGICDIFSELAEDYSDGQMDNSCDWDTPYRNIKSPFATIFKNFLGYGGGYPEKYNGFCYMKPDYKNDNNDAYVHHNSTVISHIAYLLSNGVDGDKDVSALSTTQIAQLFYKALYCMPADCNFYEFREILETVAQFMYHQGQLGTDRQLLCVAHAFDEADIILPSNNGDNDAQQSVDSIIDNNPKTLSAADVTWIVEPSYNYDDVEPIYSYLFDHYTGETLQDDRYSIYDNYYLITRGNTYSLYEMNAQSEYSDWLTVEVYPNGASDIVTYETKESRIGFYRVGLDNYSYSTILPDPWQGIGSTIPHGSSIAAIIYDTAQNKSLYVCESEMEIYTEEVSDIQEKNLEKPYPILQVDDIELTSNGLPYYFVNNYESHYASGIGGAAMFAYVSPTGKILTDFKFNQAVGFSDGLGACTVDGKWGYIDENGTAVTDFIYDGTMDVDFTYETDDTGLPKTITCAYPCTCDTMVVSRNGKIALLYRNGTTLLDFGEFEDLAPAYNNQLWAKQNGLWGLIDLADAKRKAGFPPV